MTTGLVLVHAFPLDASMWKPQTEAFGGRVAGAAPDLPGFGDSPGAGASMGGYAMFSCWRRFRDRIAGMLLADTKAEADDEAAVERRRALAENVEANGIEVVVDNPPPLLSPNAPPELWDEVKAIIARQSPEAIAAASRGMAARPDSRPILPEIDVPTIVVVGSEDAITPPANAEALAGAIGADLRVIEGAGHISNLEAPDAFNAVLSDLLDRCGL